MNRNRIIIGNKSEFNKNSFPTFEFHIAKEVRKKYSFDEELFSINGNVLFANFHAVRLFVQKINSGRKVEDHVATGQVNAAGLMDEIYHYLFRLYEVQINPGVFKKALNQLEIKIGQEEIRKILFEFVSLFPPSEVYKGKISSFDYLNSYTADRSNAEITLEELILLYFANFNPANKKIIELFDENYFSGEPLYKKVVNELDNFFQSEKKLSSDNQDMFTFLKAPIINHPDNLEAQLEFILERWGILLDEKLLKRILSSKDLIREDYKILGFGGGTPMFAPQYKGGMSDADFLTLGKSGYKYAMDSSKDYAEHENFTKDTDWMPRVVLIAKNVYVWLDQLSKRYQRYIKTLDQIPDEELDQLAGWGFNGLWLIGIWERSSASKKIKHVMGNIDAVSSAYSLYDYQIAVDLGGEDAYQNLNSRARARGIRLSSDMVPNHTGIFSKWVIEHPDYFIQTNYSPFPSYSFTGTDLSDDPTVQLRIEDGYWRRSDAAVVFQRIDNRTGDVRFIYHGNDGTNMPWNDTAQLNMIRQDVREAVIQKIFEVARKFSIIRFDAAMTLTKRHFSRLWYPEPGRGGDIPTRMDFSLTQNEFDRLFPEEFWREVVDRINSEMPDTLLLAEAFWLMEGYFVRSLGMHRVYNSAFMHMMMKEENAKYRDLISNTLEFEPEILRRYVNFMSNPDEETAIQQFGIDDKYFGVCTMLVTLPGLPMFAHGQIEGLTEKYGMEYQRAYYQETPDQWLVERHQREIFPLMKMRFLFCEVRNFWLFDFIESAGNVNENVFAFTNSEKGERAIVIFNNKYENTAGKIKYSSPKLVTQENGSKDLETHTIAETLRINPSPKQYYIFKEHISNLEYLKSGNELTSEGFYVELEAFKYLVYLNFREVYDQNGDYEKLASRLSGKGVPSISRALIEMKLEPIHSAFERIFDEQSIGNFVRLFAIKKYNQRNEKNIVRFIYQEINTLLETVKDNYILDVKPIIVLKEFEKEIKSIGKFNEFLYTKFKINKNVEDSSLNGEIVALMKTNYKKNSLPLMIWLVISNLQKLFSEKGEINKKNYFEKLLLDKPIKNIMLRFGYSESDIYRKISLLNISGENRFGVFKLDDKIEKGIGKRKAAFKYGENLKQLIELFNEDNVRIFLGLNFYEGFTYYHKESFEEMVEWMCTFSLLDLSIKTPVSKISMKKIIEAYSLYKLIKESSDKAEYKLELLKGKLF